MNDELKKELERRIVEKNTIISHMNDGKTIMDIFNESSEDIEGDFPKYEDLILGCDIFYRLTKNHPASCYGVPVLIDDDGTAYGPEDMVILHSMEIGGKVIEKKVSGADFIQYHVDSARGKFEAHEEELISLFKNDAFDYWRSDRVGLA